MQFFIPNRRGHFWGKQCCNKPAADRSLQVQGKNLWKSRAKVKKVIKKCNICKVFSTRPYGVPSTSTLPEYRTEGSRPFEVTGVDFAWPFSYKVGKKEQGKCYLIIFTCASSRAVHLEETRTQTADEFKQKLNAFISRRTRPRIIISDNVFKTTADWIKTIRKWEATGLI